MMMTILVYLLTFVELLCSFLLIGAILIQKTKQQGAGFAFGASMGESLFGSQAGNFLTRTTVVLAIIFLVNTTLLAMIGTRRRATSVTDRVAAKTEAPAAPAPAAQPPAAPSPAPVAAPDFGTPPSAGGTALPPGTGVAAPVAPAPAAPAPLAPVPAAPAP